MALYNTGNIPLPGYVQPWGSKKVWVGDHQGPKPYVTGGESLSVNSSGAPFGGIQGIEGVIPIGLTQSGNYYVVWSPAGSPGVVGQTGTLIWFQAGTFTQAASAGDLSAEYVRLLIFGV